MRQLKSIIIIVIFLSSFLAGCTSNDSDTVQLEIISLNENDWVEGQIEISIKSEMTFSEEIEVWINGNHFSDEELGIRKYFNIDISEFSDERGSPRLTYSVNSSEYYANRSKCNSPLSPTNDILVLRRYSTRV